jgi:GT2 family glycosyltransferase
MLQPLPLNGPAGIMCDGQWRMSVRHIAGAADAPDGEYDADVVILSLDRATDTEAAIRSALDQTGVSRHVFVVDQGSQPDALAQLAGVVAGRDDATLVALDHNYGVAGGRNRGSALGHGRVIFGLDNDAEFADDATLRHTVTALDADPTLAAIGCRIMLHATDDDDPTSWGYPSSLLVRAAEAFDTVTFVGAGHAIRRAAWDACGGYDDALFFCWEEFDFCLRAIERGWHIRYHGNIVIRHKVSPEQRITWSDARWFYFVRNRLYIERKWGAGWLSLAPRCIFYLLKGLHNHVLGQTIEAMRAAVRLSSGIAASRHSTAARAYMRTNDARHRSRWLATIQRLPGQVEGTRRQRLRLSLSRSRNIGGLPSR